MKLLKFLKKPDIPRFLELIAQEGELFVPQKVGEGQSEFRRWGKGSEVDWEYVNSMLPPKDFFFPQTETLFTFSQVEKELEIEGAGEPSGEARVLFGVRPCDVRSLELLDLVFNGKYVDTLYRTKREKTLIISSGCREPHPTCFCTSFGIDPIEGRGADIGTIDLGDGIAMWAMTERGESLLIKAEGILRDASSSDAERLEKERENILEKFWFKVSLDSVADELKNRFEDPLWEELSRKCLGCGICSYLCPTCHCFDIAVFERGGSGEQFRCWDTCMFSNFTRMAGGHNPRPTKKERVRNRFLHKLEYFVERYGEYGCVGCGRCLRSCPVNMDIVRVIEAIRGVGV